MQKAANLLISSLLQIDNPVWVFAEKSNSLSR